MDDVTKDSRFSHISRDPRFRGLRQKDRKVRIDKRFKSMFSDDSFKVKYTVDKRGRPLHTTTNENLRRFYDLSESEEDEEEDEAEDEENEEDEEKGGEEPKSEAKERESKNVEKIVSEQDEQVSSDEEAGHEEDEEDEDDEDDEEEDSGMESPDYARGEGDLSSTDEESTDEEEETVELPWGEMDHDVDRDAEITNRLAVCNMDWDRIRADDLMVLFNSFTPPGGVIKSVTIYPSDYGIERMAEESRKGPTELVKWSDDEDAQDETERHAEKLRIYQLNRLKYYYGVVECDSKKTANAIYEECDGLVYEGSSNGIDLRFIPEDMTFDQEAKWRVTEMPALGSYKASNFISSALQQSKVNLTWDETDPKRVQLLTRNFKKDDIEEMDMRDYLASDSDPDTGVYGPGSGVYGGVQEAVTEENEESQIQKYRALLQNTQDTDKHDDNDLDMEISWEPGLKANTESLVEKSKLKDASPWEQFLEKKREKRKAKRNKKQVESDSDIEQGEISDSEIPEGFTKEDLYTEEELAQKKLKDKDVKKKKKKKTKKLTPEELEEKKKQEAELELLMSDEEDGKKHFSLRDIIQDEQTVKGKKKRRMRHLMKEKIAKAKVKQTQEEDFKIDVTDSRFSEMYKNALFNIDPTAPEYKKTKSMEKFTEEKLKRRMEEVKHPQKSVSSKKQKLTDTGSTHTDTTQPSTDVNLATLIKSVKAKTKFVQEKKKKIKKAS